MRLRPDLLVLGCAIALVASIGAVLLINFAPDAGKVEPNQTFIALVWLGVFFVPPFLAARRAVDNGSIYGLVIGVVPVIVALLAGYSMPWFVALFFFAFAPIGGYLGQRSATARTRA